MDGACGRVRREQRAAFVLYNGSLPHPPIPPRFGEGRYVPVRRRTTNVRNVTYAIYTVCHAVPGSKTWFSHVHVSTVSVHVNYIPSPQPPPKRWTESHASSYAAATSILSQLDNESYSSMHTLLSYWRSLARSTLSHQPSTSAFLGKSSGIAAGSP
jgi:hypothetical protein